LGLSTGFTLDSGAIANSQLWSTVHYNNTQLVSCDSRPTPVLLYRLPKADVSLPLFANCSRPTATATHSALSVFWNCLLCPVTALCCPISLAHITPRRTEWKTPLLYCCGYAILCRNLVTDLYCCYTDSGSTNKEHLVVCSLPWKSVTISLLWRILCCVGSC
jgi:hypothetical protein